MPSEIIAALLGALVVLIVGGYLFALREWKHAASERDTMRGQRDFAMEQLRESRAAVTELQRQNANYERSAKGRLYREALEDKQGNAVGAATFLRRMRDDLDAATDLLTKGGR